MADGSSAVGAPASADMLGDASGSEDDGWMWYPSGHGGVYGALAREGVLQELIDAGKTHIFISDIENVGATLDDRRDDDWRVNITFGDIEASFRRRRVFFPEFGLNSFMDCAAIREIQYHATVSPGRHQ